MISALDRRSFFTPLFAALALLASGSAAAQVAETQAVNEQRAGSSQLERPGGVVSSALQWTDSNAPPNGVWLVTLQDPGLARYDGSLPDMPMATRRARTDGSGTKIDARSWQSRAYLDHLESRQREDLETISYALGREVEPIVRHQVLRSAVAVLMTAEEAQAVERLSNVASVTPDRLYPLTSDASADWIGAPAVWDGTQTADQGETLGEGVIIGVIDSGIDPDHEAFSDLPDDEHTYTNPFGPGNYVGECDGESPEFPCNAKLIGAWDFIDALAGTNPDTMEPCEDDGAYDDEGHGTHVASIAAGNRVNWPASSGIAPHANLISYDVCFYLSRVPGFCPQAMGSPPFGACSQVAIQSALDQAVLDGVDIVNISIQGGADPWHANSIDGYALDALEAGILVVSTAGNQETEGTVTHLGPWVLTAAATTHDRISYPATLTLSGGDVMPPGPTFEGTSLSATGLPAATPIVWAGSHEADLEEAPEFSYSAERCLQPFSSGSLTGKVVVCTFFGRPDRPYTQVLKAQNVAAGGAVGMIVLGNPGLPSELQAAWPHPIPTFQVTGGDNSAIELWVTENEGGTDELATIALGTRENDSDEGDLLWFKTSRGPTDYDLLKPDVAAPGYNIFGAEGGYYSPGYNGSAYIYRSGTSMAAPQLAGTAALVKALHPSWTPSEIKSAITTTAHSAVLDETGTASATPWDVGSGRVDAAAATRAGLVFPETRTNYENADPGNGGDPATLNVPSLAKVDCPGTCQWTRTVRNTRNVTTSWRATKTGPAGFLIDVSPSSFSLAPGASQVITITILNLDASLIPARRGTAPPAAEDYQFGTIELANDDDDPDLPTVRIPYAVTVTDVAWEPLFSDAFESNDVCAWSRAVGGVCSN